MAKHICDECGQEFQIDWNDIAQHLDEEGGIDFDRDADHVPYQTQEK